MKHATIHDFLRDHAENNAMVVHDPMIITKVHHVVGHPFTHYLAAEGTFPDGQLKHMVMVGHYTTIDPATVTRQKSKHFEKRIVESTQTNDTDGLSSRTPFLDQLVDALYRLDYGNIVVTRLEHEPIVKVEADTTTTRESFSFTSTL